jgi:hypothetical protein
VLLVDAAFADRSFHHKTCEGHRYHRGARTGRRASGPHNRPAWPQRGCDVGNLLSHPVLPVEGGHPPPRTNLATNDAVIVLPKWQSNDTVRFAGCGVNHIYGRVIAANEESLVMAEDRHAVAGDIGCPTSR